MKTLSNYIFNNKGIKKLSEEEYNYLLQLDKEYGDLYKEFWFKWNRTDCKNIDTEFEKFLDARQQHKKYYPQLELVEDSLDNSFLEKSLILERKFKEFNCYLSQFYIENIHYLYNQAVVTIKKGNKEALALNNFTMCPPVSKENYKAAWKLIRKHPFLDVREDQNYTGKDIKQMMQDHIDKLGYKYKVELDKYMVARQNVVPHEPVLNIKTDAHFSEIDVASLKVHEVEVHVARRYYGAQTGLNLFLDGLAYRNTTDEGMAIYQSLHHNPKGVKPNLEFEIAIKTIIGYHIMDMDFCELFNYLLPKLKTKDNKDVIKKVIFQNLVRFKRVIQDCSLPGGDAMSETDYFCGYQAVKNMSAKLKNDLIHWNVGLNHIKDIPDIKKFFELNKFKPLF